MTDTARETRQIAMYGCTAEALDHAIAEYTERHAGPGPAGHAALMLAMSMLSDSQEQLERGQSERARQTINQAKYVISDVRDEMRLAAARALTAPNARDVQTYPSQRRND